MISENYNIENDVFANEKDKRLMQALSKDLTDNDEIWKNFDVEETTIKLELTEMVLDQLLNEVVEILEHVNLSRVKPELYQYNSIYSCDDIPKLSFQQTENDLVENDNNNFDLNSKEQEDEEKENNIMNKSR